eukprot:7425520-Alexandrium_andersonii.AAC.1
MRRHGQPGWPWLRLAWTKPVGLEVCSSSSVAGAPISSATSGGVSARSALDPKTARVARALVGHWTGRCPASGEVDG